MTRQLQLTQTAVCHAPSSGRRQLAPYRLMLHHNQDLHTPVLQIYLPLFNIITQLTNGKTVQTFNIFILKSTIQTSWNTIYDTACQCQGQANYWKGCGITGPTLILRSVAAAAGRLVDGHTVTGFGDSNPELGKF